MSVTNSIRDLSNVTSIPYSSLTKVSDVIENIICHSFIESLNNFEDKTVVELGFGKLHISLINEDEVRYYFYPSASLEKKLIDAFTDKKDPLVESLEDSLTTKIMNSYKDLF